ncbi:MAG TPA: carbohydrate ABC transporter permease [Acetobacteraceae bacterium]|nr:carbohydrate ABC transporter permease [Acetobacteraceae bacterium]
MIGRTLRWLLFLLTVLLLNLPVIVTVLTSLKTDADINASPPVWLFAPTLAHYRAVLDDPTLDFPRYLANSTVIAGGGTLLALALAVPAAYGMVRSGAGARLVLPLMVNLRAVPLVVFAIPFYLMYQVLGLLDTRLGLALIACIINLPLSLLIAVNAIAELPLEIEDAARVDGARTRVILARIVLPLARPMLISAGILGFITAWNEFLFGLILSTRNAVPVTVAATFFTTSFGVRWGDTAAAMVLSMAPPMVLGLVAARGIGSALTTGAVKG